MNKNISMLDDYSLSNYDKMIVRFYVNDYERVFHDPDIMVADGSRIFR
jgi:hypothetical protein